MQNKVLKKIQGSSEYKVISTWVLLTSMIFHIFILKKHGDFSYFLVTIIYLSHVISRKNVGKSFFRDGLAGILVCALMCTLKLVKEATIVMDYVYILLALGITYEALRLIRNSIANSPEETQI